MVSFSVLATHAWAKEQESVNVNAYQHLRSLCLLAMAVGPLSAGCDRKSMDSSEIAATAGTLELDGTVLSLTVNEKGYSPSEFKAAGGKRVRMLVKRVTDEGCGQQLVFPSLGIRRDLPLNKKVEVVFTMPLTGEVEFTCGMAMYKGKVIAE